ncbi:carbohydrate ABC transporter permease [Planotetraspora phitsanulokensis]|uniref:ABC transporter permease n=1 Tax=Planotetraspora phitsanulokensis TaxID=575192 RepID=A0A8J3U8K1_9ACTN|nr:carbohydrate ABC transporter permease [Planotetraspora phitsanulokensis]GII40300.1 ABC transporter permease [Planotetraspora phitsanulokensis]
MSNPGRPVWLGKPKPVAVALKALALVLISAVVIFPFLVVVSTSLATKKQIDANGGYVLWPTQISFEAYHQIFNGTQVARSIVISVGVTVVGTAFSLFCTVLAAYGLSRRGSLFQRGLLSFVLLTLLFGPGMIPVYLMVKQLGMLDSYWSLIIPGAVSAFNIVIVRGFIQGIPKELFDAARIDGAGEWRILRSIVLPLSKAVIAVVGLFLAVGYWNNYFSPLLYLNDTQKWPLQLVMRTFVLQNNVTSTAHAIPGYVAPPAQSVQMALVAIATLPILCVYPFLTKHMSKGMLTGAVKG